MRTLSRRPATTRLAFLFLALAACLPARADERREMPVAPGVRYVEMRRTAPDGRPWAIYVLQVERGRPDIAFRSTKGKGLVVGGEAMRIQSARAAGPGATVVAAVNGDFYGTGATFLGLPTGLQLRDGELLTSPNPDRPVFGANAEGRPLLGNAALSGSLAAGEAMLPIAAVNKVVGANGIVLYTPAFGAGTRAQGPMTAVVLRDVAPALPLRAGTSYAATVAEVQRDVKEAAIPASGLLLAAKGEGAAALAKLSTGLRVAFTVSLSGEWAKARDAVGGWPVLVHAGKVEIGGASESAMKAIHPRTTVGFNDTHLFFVAVDGRQPGHSMGMSFAELAELMLELGCTEAANLDGGGSTTMVVRGAVMNHPSDGIDRSVSNGWAVLSTAPAGPLHRLRLWPEGPSVLSGSRLAFQVSGVDENGAPVPVSPADVAWKVSTTLGSVDDGGVFTAGPNLRAGLVRATVGKLSAATTVNVWLSPVSLSLAPARAALAPGGSLPLRLLATDAAGRPLTLDPEAARWSVAGDGASVDARGRLTAGVPGTVTVAATVGELTARATVEVRDP